MDKDVTYANWWSKALFKKNFEKQHYIPLPPRLLDRALLNGIERAKFSRDFSGIPIVKPIFIVGLPRSGTTLLYNLLCAHESAAFITNSMNSFTDAVCAIEWLRKTFHLNIRGERFLADSIDTDFGSPSEPIMFWAKWFGRDVEALHWQERRGRDFTPTQIDAVKRDFKKILFCFGGAGRRLVFKYPVMQTELRMLQDMFPDAKFIHILRDGRDVAHSLVKLYRLSNDQLRKIDHPTVKHIIPYPRVERLKDYLETYGPESVECTARVWRDAIELVSSVRGDLHSFFEVRHESIVRDPTAELRRIFEFCELSWPENPEFASTLATVGRVRHKNHYAQNETIERVVGPMLQRLGYL